MNIDQNWIIENYSFSCEPWALLPDDKIVSQQPCWKQTKTQQNNTLKFLKAKQINQKI